MKKSLIYIVLFVASTFTLYSLYKRFDPVERVIHQAGDNASELRKVIDHYDEEDLPFQKECAQFLIKEMGVHYSVYQNWYDTKGNSVFINPRDFKWRGNVEHHIKQNSLVQQTDSVVNHNSFIGAQFLIDNVDRACSAWQQTYWKDSISKQDFMEYVLPYCMQHEKLAPWRGKLSSYMLDERKLKFDPKESDPRSIARTIRGRYDPYGWYTSKAFVLPKDQNCDEILKYRSVDCVNHACMIVFTCRSLGIAAALNKIPLWGNRNNGHAEPSVLGSDNKWHNIGDRVWHSGQHSSHASKVFRQTYSSQPWTLAYRTEDPQTLPPLLRSTTYVDATSDFCPAVDIEGVVDTALTEDVVYSCVFNNGRWQAVHWSDLDDGSYRFTQMAPLVAYLPAYYKQENYISANYPFYSNLEGEKVEFKPNYQNVQEVTISRWHLNHRIDKKIKPDDKVYLYVWDGSWKYLEKVYVDKKGATFKKVPHMGLCKIESMNSTRPRPFSLEDKVKWW